MLWVGLIVMFVKLLIFVYDKSSKSVNLPYLFCIVSIVFYVWW